MVAALLLTAAAPAVFFIYDLWAVTASLFIVLPFVLRKHSFTEPLGYFLLFTAAALIISARSPASFESFLFVLQSFLYAAFFIAGIEAGGKKTLIPLAALALIPFVFASRVNPNIISSYAGLLFVLALISPIDKKIKIMLAALSVFFILLNSSWTVLFVLAAAGILTGRKKYLPLIALAALFAATANPLSMYERFMWWREALNIFAANPLGIGFFAAKYYLPASAAQNTLFVHSFFLQFIAEGGLLCIIPAAFALRTVVKNRRGGKYDFALWAVLLLGLLDLSYHIAAHGMLAAFIVGLSQKRGSLSPKDGKTLPVISTNVMRRNLSIIFKTLFVAAAAFSILMFHSSRALALGSGALFSGSPREALAEFSKASEYPPYSALLSAKAAAYSILAEQEGRQDYRERSFKLQEKAIPDKKSAAWLDFERARETDDLSVLRNSCMKILFLDAVRPGQ